MFRARNVTLNDRNRETLSLKFTAVDYSKAGTWGRLIYLYQIHRALKRDRKRIKES